MSKENCIIFGLPCSKELSLEISELTKIRLGNSHFQIFADGETLFATDEAVRGYDVFLIQSTSKPVNQSIMELLIAIDAMRRASANSITVVIPYYGYSRQDRKCKGREPITSRLIADMLQVAGTNRVLTIDIHSQQQQGFFSIPFDSLTAIWLMLDFLLKEKGFVKENLVIVAPDYGSVKRSRSISEKLEVEFAIVDKRRPKANVVEISDVLGNVEGKDCILPDDMIDTGGTMIGAATLLKSKGAKSITILATHALFNGEAKKNFEKAIKDKIIDKILVTNSIDNKETIPNGTIVISIGELISDAINVYVKGSGACISEIYKKWKYSKVFE